MCARLTAAIVSYAYINDSQGSVATQFRCGGIINNHFIANFQQSVPVKEFLKSVNNWWRYGQKYSGMFFLTYGVGPCMSRKRENAVTLTVLISTSIQSAAVREHSHVSTVQRFFYRVKGPCTCCSATHTAISAALWLAWGDDTAAHYVVIHCSRWRTIGPAVQHTDIPPLHLEH